MKLTSRMLPLFLAATIMVPASSLLTGCSGGGGGGNSNSQSAGSFAGRYQINFSNVATASSLQASAINSGDTGLLIVNRDGTATLTTGGVTYTGRRTNGKTYVLTGDDGTTITITLTRNSDGSFTGTGTYTRGSSGGGSLTATSVFEGSYLVTVQYSYNSTGSEGPTSGEDSFTEIVTVDANGLISFPNEQNADKVGLVRPDGTATIPEIVYNQNGEGFRYTSSVKLKNVKFVDSNTDSEDSVSGNYNAVFTSSGTDGGQTYNYRETQNGTFSGNRTTEVINLSTGKASLQKARTHKK